MAGETKELSLNVVEAFDEDGIFEEASGWVGFGFAVVGFLLLVVDFFGVVVLFVGVELGAMVVVVRLDEQFVVDLEDEQVWEGVRRLAGRRNSG